MGSRMAAGPMDASAPGPGGSDEALAVRLRIHPSTSVILLVLSLAAVVIGSMFAAFIARQDLSVGRGIGLIVFLSVLVAVLGAIHYVRSTEYLVTDRSAVARAGFLEERTDRVPLADVEGVSVEAPLHKRAFGMGDVRLVPSASDRAPVRFAFVDEPHALKAQLLSLVESGEAESPASATHSSSGSSRD